MTTTGPATKATATPSRARENRQRQEGRIRARRKAGTWGSTGLQEHSANISLKWVFLHPLQHRNAPKLPSTLWLPGAAPFPLGPTEGVAHNCRKRDSEVLLPPLLPRLRSAPRSAAKPGALLPSCLQPQALHLPSFPQSTASRAHRVGLEARKATSFQPRLQVPWQTDLYGHEISSSSSAKGKENRTQMLEKHEQQLSFLLLSSAPRATKQAEEASLGGMEAPSRSHHLTATGWLCSELLKSKPCPIPAR